MSPEYIRLLFSEYGYFIIFLAAFLDGFHIMLIAGFLASLGHIALWPTLLALFLGNVLSDAAWFLLAYFGGEKAVLWIARFHRSIHEYLEKAKTILHSHTGKVIIGAKLTLGLALATILAAGISKMKFRKFILYDFIACLGVVIEMTLIGYFLGESYSIASDYFKVFGYIIIALGIAAVIVVTILNRKRNRA